jgi:hypothetical protein
MRGKKVKGKEESSLDLKRNRFVSARIKNLRFHIFVFVFLEIDSFERYPEMGERLEERREERGERRGQYIQHHKSFKSAYKTRRNKKKPETRNKKKNQEPNSRNKKKKKQNVTNKP